MLGHTSDDACRVPKSLVWPACGQEPWEPSKDRRPRDRSWARRSARLRRPGLPYRHRLIQARGSSLADPEAAGLALELALAPVALGPVPAARVPWPALAPAV